MKKTILLAILLCVSLAWLESAHLSAQTVSNVVAKQVGNTIEITYDITNSSEVGLLLSQDGGKTYAPVPQTITGDVGQVSAGHHKMIWDLLADDTDWDIERARFMVVAKKQEKLTFEVKGVSFTMILVEGGSFEMGCTSEQGTDCHRNEEPWHYVTLTEYYIGQTEVTQALWKAVMGEKKYEYLGDNYPVGWVNWFECQEFIKRLNLLLSSELGSRLFALPTEAQWEYAARGGHKKPPYQFKYSGSDILGSVAWYKENSNKKFHPVATKSPNTLGIYDMSGNVQEWCQDWKGAWSGNSLINPQGASSGTYRVIRGGSIFSDKSECRVADRCNYRYEPQECINSIGFRLVLQ